MDKRWKAIAKLQKAHIPVYGDVRRFIAGIPLNELAMDELLKEGNWRNCKKTRNVEQIVRKAVHWAIRRIDVRKGALEKRINDLIPTLEV